MSHLTVSLGPCCVSTARRYMMKRRGFRRCCLSICSFLGSPSVAEIASCDRDGACCSCWRQGEGEEEEEERGRSRILCSVWFVNNSVSGYYFDYVLWLVHLSLEWTQ